MKKHPALAVSQEAMDWLKEEHPDVAEKCHVDDGTTQRVLAPNEIQAIRDELGISQEQFALQLWVGVDSVRSWETGRRQPGGSACRLMLLMKNRKI